MLQARVSAFVALLMAASAVAILVKLVPIPYVSALALAGLGAGALLGPGPLAALPLTHDLILFVLLPGLLFEASFRLSWGHLRANLAPVLALATLGVALTTAVVAMLAHWALGLAVPLAVLLGAMVAPTDPVAVVAVFRRLLAPARLVNLIEAESLINDGTGVVVFTIALAAVGAGTIQPAAALLDFARLALGGVALGLALGFGVSFLTSRIDDFQVELTLTAVAAYGGYLVGEAVHVSGILTVVAAGLVLGNFGRPRGMSARTQQAVDLFWDYVAFVLNSVVFLLVGLEVPLPALLANFAFLAAAAAIVLLARAVTVYSVLGLLRPLGQSVSLSWQHLLVWGGLRGAVAVALALSLAEQEQGLGTVRALVWGVALITIVVQGMTVGPLARALLREQGPARRQSRLWPGS